MEIFGCFNPINNVGYYFTLLKKRKHNFSSTDDLDTSVTDMLEKRSNSFEVYLIGWPLVTSE